MRRLGPFSLPPPSICLPIAYFVVYNLYIQKRLVSLGMGWFKVKEVKQWLGSKFKSTRSQDESDITSLIYL